MNSIKKILKVLFLSFILLILSAGYWVFGEKRNNFGGGLFDIDKASADVPAAAPGCGVSGTDSGTAGGTDGGTGEGGTDGDS